MPSCILKSSKISHAKLMMASEVTARGVSRSITLTAWSEINMATLEHGEMGGGGGGLPNERGGGNHRTFQGLKFVVSCRLWCLNPEFIELSRYPLGYKLEKILQAPVLF